MLTVPALGGYAPKRLGRCFFAGLQTSRYTMQMMLSDPLARFLGYVLHLLKI